MGLVGLLWVAGSGMAIAQTSPAMILLSDGGDSVPDVIVNTEEPANDPASTSDYTGEKRFTCELLNGRYTVTYHPKSEPMADYAWAVPRALGGGWTAEKRCGEISRRLESYRPDGLLELQTAMENNYETVCVTTEAVPQCRIVFTVPPGQDAIATRNQVFENLVQANEGQATVGVETFQENNGTSSVTDILGQVGGLLGNSGILSPGQSSGGGGSHHINLKPFLDPADGGTGVYLGGNGHFNSRPAPRLDPSVFR